MSTAGFREQAVRDRIAARRTQADAERLAKAVTPASLPRPAAGSARPAATWRLSFSLRSLLPRAVRARRPGSEVGPRIIYLPDLHPAEQAGEGPVAASTAAEIAEMNAG